MGKVKSLTELQEAEHRDNEYHYFMGRIDALKEVLSITKDQFMSSKIDSDCFIKVTAVIDEIIEKEHE